MGFSAKAGQADVEFGTNLGVFRRELGEAGALYSRTTGAMSTESLRAAVAHERLTKTVTRYGPESTQAKNATVAYRREMQLLEGTSRHATTTIDKEERSIGRLSRGALKGSGAARSLGLSLAFASSAFIGAAGLSAALRSSIDAAEEEQKTLAALQATLGHLGISWDKNRGQIEHNLDAQIRLSGFARSDLLPTFNTLVRRTGDVDQALKLTSLATDIARGTGKDLTAVTTLLIRAMAGNARAATTLGLPIADLSKLQNQATASGHKLTTAQLKQAQANATIAEATRRYGGQAAAFMQTAAGKTALFRAEVKRTEEIIGTAFLPVLTHLTTHLGRYLEKLNRTGRLQRDVNHAVHTGTEVAHGLETTYHALAAVIAPVNRELGGTRRTVELLATAYLILKARQAALGLGLLRTEVGGIALGWGRVRTSAKTAAAAEGEAAAAGNGALGLKLGLLGRIFLQYAAIYEIVKHLGHPKLGFDFSDPLGNGNFVNGARRNWKKIASATSPGNAAGGPGSAAGKYTLFQGPDGYYIQTPSGSLLGPYDTAQQAWASASILNPPLGTASPPRSDSATGGRNNGTYTRPTTGRERRAAAGGRSTRDAERQQLRQKLAKADEALILAGLTRSQADDLRAYREEEAAIRGLLSIGGQSRARRIDLEQQLVGATEGERSILDARSQTARDARDKRRRAADAARRKAQEAARKRDAALRAQRQKRVRELTEVPIDLRIEEQQALAHHAGEERLLAIYRKELAAIEKQLKVIRAQHLGKDAVLKATQTEAAVQKKIDDLKASEKKKRKQQQAADTESVYADAAAEARTYGSSLGRGPLSGQDARGMLGQIALLLRENNRHSQETARNTRRPKTPRGQAAAGLAHVGGV